MEELLVKAHVAATSLADAFACLDEVSSSDPERWRVATEAVERLGRIVDGARARVAAEADGADGVWLAGKLGRRGGVDALAVTAGVSEREARARIRVGAATTARTSITGAILSAEFPEVAAAITDGRLGLEAAGVIVRELGEVAIRADCADMARAEEGLVALATGAGASPVPATVEQLIAQSRLFATYLDPDGARPREERAVRRRSLRIGAEDADGLVPLHGRLDIEIGSTLRALIEAHRRAGRPTVFAAESGPDAPADLTAPTDGRTPDQQRHDAFAALVSAAARMVDTPQLAGAGAAVLVTVDAADLENPDGRAGDGIGRVDQSPSPMSRTRVEGLADRNGVQKIAVDASGRVARIFATTRCFTPAQRRALIARDAGCVIPGCSIPASWTEAHHVIPDRDGGPTHTDNGCLVCWWHHSRIDSGPWRIRMVGGLPYIRGPGHPEWTRATRRLAHPARAG